MLAGRVQNKANVIVRGLFAGDNNALCAAVITNNHIISVTCIQGLTKVVASSELAVAYGDVQRGCEVSAMTVRYLEENVSVRGAPSRL